MSNGKDNENPSQMKKSGTAMSFRQQIRYVLEKSMEEKSNNDASISDDQLHELEDYLQDEDLRVKLI